MVLPPVAPALAVYVPANRCGSLVYVSGQVPMEDGVPLATGHVPHDVSVEHGAELARRCALQALAALDGVLAAGEGLTRVCRVGGFVACDAGFTEHPAVINGASLLLEEVFGDRARHARAAVGVISLPLGVPVEIEFLFEVGALETSEG
ncbi:MAG: RidA family protein [Planctomycetota bacterium]